MRLDSRSRGRRVAEVAALKLPSVTAITRQK